MSVQVSTRSTTTNRHGWRHATQRVVAIIPAHNEQATLPATIRSLLIQTRPPDHIVVASDNSTDATPQIARSWGRKVQLFETRDNRDRKAGALNQVLEWIDEPDDTWVLIVDADSVLSATFIETAIDAARQPDVGAVGGTLVGDGRNGLLGAMQHLEFVRRARGNGRAGGTAHVLTGPVTFIRLGLLREVKTARAEGRLPGSGIYDTSVLTEDFCLTMAVRSLGYRWITPRGCLVSTETMGTLGDLWRQRVRWQRGALQTLRNYGVNRTTLPYILRQVGTVVGLAGVVLMWIAILWWLGTGTLVIHPVWLGVGAVVQLSRLVSGWGSGWGGRFVAGTVLVDLAFGLFIGAVYVSSLVKTLRGSEPEWGTPSVDGLPREVS